MADASNAGPYDIGPEEPLSPEEKRPIRFSEVSAGPSNSVGYLKKIYGDKGGLDFVFVVNTSGQPIAVYTRGGRTTVPPATSQPLSNGPYRSVSVENLGSSEINTGSGDMVSIEVGNGERPSAKNERRKTPSFSARKALNDAIPGMNL